MNDSTHTYGLLLAFDGYGALLDPCGNTARIRELLQTLPGRIGMRALGQPHIVSVDEEGIAGISGFIFIMESHISVHTYSERKFVTVDIYSCKQFDTEAAVSFLAEFFGVTSYEAAVLPRGRYWEMPIDSLPPRPHLRP